MSAEIVIPRRTLGTLLNATAAGVVPRTGLEYMAIGRENEVRAILNDFENVADGMGAFRFLIGRYGSGKSFLIGLMRSNALERDFVTADADLSPERRFSGTKGQGVATYRELMKNLATKSSPDGGALSVILSRWFSKVQAEVVTTCGLTPNDEAFSLEVQKRITETATSLQSLVNGFDFSHVLTVYYRAVRNGDDHLASDAMRWLRGEFSTRTEARSALAVSTIIDDSNWYDYLKLQASFFRAIGYRGLIVFFDECVNLYKIPNRISRENNYEKVLSMFNDTLQGKAEGLGIYMGGTPKFLEDERRGLYSYEALKSRLCGGHFAGEYTDWLSPVIRLSRLDDSALFALLVRMQGLFSRYHNIPPALNDQALLRFLQFCLDKMGSDEYLTPREVLRDFLHVQSILMQNPTLSVDTLLGDGAVTMTRSGKEETEDDPFGMNDIVG